MRARDEGKGRGVLAIEARDGQEITDEEKDGERVFLDVSILKKNNCLPQKRFFSQIASFSALGSLACPGMGPWPQGPGHKS
jgi:hypothetical protein